MKYSFFHQTIIHNPQLDMHNLTKPNNTTYYINNYKLELRKKWIRWIKI